MERRRRTSVPHVTKKTRQRQTRPESQTIEDQEPIILSLEESIVELGRRFSAVFISYQMDITYETARKNIRRNCGDAPPSSYWIDLSKQVWADFANGRFGPGRRR
jgi:hypothetical protein